MELNDNNLSSDLYILYFEILGNLSLSNSYSLKKHYKNVFNVKITLEKFLFRT